MTAKVPGIVSLVLALAAVLNFVLNACRIATIPVDEAAITATINGVVGLIGVIGTMWYNFNATDAAKVGQNIKDGIINGTIDLGKAQKLVTDAAKKAEALAKKPEITD